MTPPSPPHDQTEREPERQEAERRFAAPLGGVLREALGETAWRGRPLVRLDKGGVLYGPETEGRGLFVIVSGIVKVGSVTEDGHELIYQIRRGGDVVGELCASRRPPRDRAVALEPTQAIGLSMEDVLDLVSRDREALRGFVGMVSDSLSEAYDHLHTMAFKTVAHRLANMLVRLGRQIGRPSAEGTEIAAYVTQEELAHMVGVRRERLSTAMNYLRRRGMVAYSRRGHIVVDLPTLQAYASLHPGI